MNLKKYFQEVFGVTEDLSMNREDIFRDTLRKLLIYFFFVVITSILVLCMLPSLLFTYTKILEAQFLDVQFETESSAHITFANIQTVKDFWIYLETVACKNLYNSDASNTTEDKDQILYENQLLGVPRLRQLRVRNDSCQVHEYFQRMFTGCYAGYSKAAEDQQSFGKASSDAWQYQTHAQLKGSYYWGLLALYDGGGFCQDLSQTTNESLQIVTELKENFWVTKNTRVVFLDFALYNANINLFCVVKLLFEFPPTGGVMSSSTFRTVKLIRYVTPEDFFVLGCELVFISFIIYYAILEIEELKHYGFKRYLTAWWNYVDLAIIIVSLACTAFSIYRFLFVQYKIKELQHNPNIFTSFESLAFWQIQYSNALAIILFILLMKIFKYINISRTMGQLNATLSRCAVDIAHFSAMFFIVFIAFAQVGYLLFGALIERFSTFGNSIMTLLMTILGDFDYYEIEKTNKILAPMFFTTYIFFVFFVLFNMFLAIITDTYSDVKYEIKMKDTELELIDFLKRGPRNFINKCKKNKLENPKKKSKGNEIIGTIRKILNE